MSIHNPSGIACVATNVSRKAGRCRSSYRWYALSLSQVSGRLRSSLLPWLNRTRPRLRLNGTSSKYTRSLWTRSAPHVGYRGQRRGWRLAMRTGRAHALATLTWTNSSSRWDECIWLGTRQCSSFQISSSWWACVGAWPRLRLAGHAKGNWPREDILMSQLNRFWFFCERGIGLAEISRYYYMGIL